EEYSEYVNTFNDAFAFYVSGPGIAAPAPGQNIALIPGTPLPVSINNINNGFSPPGIAPNGPCVNCAYYVDHTNGIELEFDGFTIPLLATVEVQPCQTYHLTLVIADALDQFYDSGVFLEANGIGCLDPALAIAADNRLGVESTVLVESCQDTGWFSFTLSQVPQDTLKFALSYGGTASMGLDYLPLPDTVVFPPGVDTIHWPVVILSDALVEGVETLTIVYQGAQACSGQVLGDSAEFMIREQPFWVFPLPDTLTLCSGGAASLTLPSQAGWTYQWSDSTGIDTPSSATPTLSLVNQGAGPDTVMYSLRVEALGGLCGIEDSFWVIVYPESGLGIQPTVSCANQAQQFQLTGLSAPLASVSWLMGDGASYTGLSPTHSYLSPGNYLLEAMTVDQFGCEDTFRQVIQVNPSPEADFTADSLCLGEALALNPNQLGLGELRTWWFGDGQQSAEIAPLHLYDSAGSYLIQHVVTNNFGCQDTAEAWVAVWANPTAGFLADSICLGDSLTLTSISTGGGSPLLPLSWSLNGGASLTGDTLMTYPALSGLWEVSLLVEDARGCRDTSRRMVRVFNPPEASFLVDSACAQTWQPWTSTATPGDTSLLVWSWDWGDGNVGSGPQATHRFDSAGLFPVTHVVVDALGCTDTLTQVARSFALPVASFRVDSVCLGNETSPIPDSLANDWTHRWTWGNGSPDSQDPLPTINYPTSGSYQVTHIVRDPRGCADTMRVQTEIYGLPTADFSSSSDCLFRPTAFTNLSFAADWPLVAYQWNFGPAGASNATNPIVTFDQPGQRPVTLVVTDLFGCSDTLAQPAQVYRPPQAIFSSDTGCISGPLLFQDQSIPGDAPLLTWDWELGDGTLRLTPQFEHLYDSVATYLVRLEVADSLGCRDTLLRRTRIFPLPEVSFTTDPACDGLPVQFISGPQDPGASYRWNFGDGEGSFLPNPQRLYAGAGSYQVFLRVATAAGCADSVAGTVTVYQNPTPAFLAEDVCLGEFTRFQNQSQAGDHPLARYRWSLGDGSNSQLTSPTHRYESHGDWRVRLQAIDSYGCRADTVLPVKVWAKPNLAFSPDTACAGSPISLLDLSTVPDESLITQRFWTLPGNRR
ncbi:MAG: PKD domain-containing protein, partial [Bacteroidota bacterium]